MKNSIKLIAILIFAFTFTACNGQSKTNTQTTTKAVSKIEVIDFHSTHRCMTCNAIEANTKYTLDTFFAKEMEQNKISFQVINVDEKKNEKIAEKFEAFGTALVLNVIKEGKETKIDITDFAFMKGNDKEAFTKELKAKIDKELKSL